MKNKALTYVLIAVVGFIWFKVFVKIKSNITAEEVPAQNTRIDVYAIPSVRDTFTIAANYRDPFLTNNPVKVPTQDRNNEPPPLIRKPVYQWPSIKYFGLVKNTKSTKPLAIVKFDQVQLMVRENDHVWNDLLIRKIYRDSILITHGKNRKVVYRD